MSEEKKKEINEIVEILKDMNQDDLTATKFLSLGVVSAAGRTEQKETSAHE